MNGDNGLIKPLGREERNANIDRKRDFTHFHAAMADEGGICQMGRKRSDLHSRPLSSMQTELPVTDGEEPVPGSAMIADIPY